MPTEIHANAQIAVLDDGRAGHGTAAVGGDSLAQAAARDIHELCTVRIMRLAEILGRGVARVYEEGFGVKMTELRILVLLGSAKSLSVNEVSRIARIDKGWISRSLESMVRRGLVERSAHPTDSRISLVSLTALGAKMIRDFAPIARARNARLLDGMDGEDVCRMLDTLEKRADELLDMAGEDGAGLLDQTES